MKITVSAKHEEGFTSLPFWKEYIQFTDFFGSIGFYFSPDFFFFAEQQEEDMDQLSSKTFVIFRQVWWRDVPESTFKKSLDVSGSIFYKI